MCIRDRLYACERLVHRHPEIPPSLKTYTKYLIVIVYYRAGKFFRCIEMARKIIETNKEIDTVSIQYLMHIRYLLAKALYANKNCAAAIKTLVELIRGCSDGLRGSVFGDENLLVAKESLAQYLLVAACVKVGERFDCRSYQSVHRNSIPQKLRLKEYNSQCMESIGKLLC
eukprot:TRINITY_DN13962_c0_g1_i1.p1 TRINITY_DN13962_c0_g1~~TRINITY_DN13962_c0_g1_i1.p1  ORF type:complete len:188 (-),score=17.58 TRINITY_DN13962_c0_g1_i1:202-714(-)